MDGALKTPEQLLAYRTIPQLLAGKSGGVTSIALSRSVFEALELMEQRDIGFLVVMEQDEMVGVVSERDYARKIVLAGRGSRATPVGDIMTNPVVTVTPTDSVPHCMALMAEKRIRHLAVAESGRVIGVLWIRDLLKEIITHHERLIRQMELERITIMNSGAGSY